MLCLSGFELYSRWVPLIRELKQQRQWRLQKHHLTSLGYSISFSQTLANFSGVEFQKELYRRWRKFEESRSLVFTSSKKREISHFHVVVVQWWQKNVPKIVMHVQSCCFVELNLLLFCRSCCRRRHRCLSSYYIINFRHTTSIFLRIFTPQVNFYSD